MLRPDYPITTERLLLRPFRPEDLDGLHSIQSRSGVTRYLYWNARSRGEVRRQLEEYFKGDRRSFELTLDWSRMQGFRRRLLKATARIPYGQLTTYKQIAGRAGSPRGSRAAGGALGSNPIPIVVPCHRVVASGGGLGGYTGGLDKKRFLLSLEGVSMTDLSARETPRPTR